MFNILKDKLPSSISGDGFVYPINTDFRNCIEFEKIMFGQNDLSKKDRILKSLTIFLGEIPDAQKIEPCIKGIVDFYRCGKEQKQLNPAVAKKAASHKPPKIFDFEYDSAYIYAAFIQAYGIDLTQSEMHWYKFRALFDALPDDCKFTKILGYRGTDVGQIKNNNEKQRIIKLQTIYALPHSLTAEQKSAEADRLLRGG